MAVTGEDLAEAIQKIAEADLQKADPFRPCLNFLIGHFTFTLAILAAALASLPKKDAELAPAMTAALGGVLSWMALSALIASVVTLIIQVLKTRFIKQKQAGKTVEPQTAIALFLCALPIIPGAFAVFFCLRAGMTLMKEVSSLPSVAQAFSLLL